MVVIPEPQVGAQAAWMRNALLVVALAESGEAGAEAHVPGASLVRPSRAALPMLLG